MDLHIEKGVFKITTMISTSRVDHFDKILVSLIYAASSDATARLWSMTSGEDIRVYQGHHKATVCCALHDGAEPSAC